MFWLTRWLRCLLNYLHQNFLLILYGLQVFNLGLLYHGFRDAIRDGDGDRVILYWKALLIIFRTSNYHNYSKEALLLLVQQQTFPERLAMQMKWSRFVNNKGRTGCNIPCDLAMEHLNRRLKSILHNLEANIQPSSIVRDAKSIGIIDSYVQHLKNLFTSILLLPIIQCLLITRISTKFWMCYWTRTFSRK